jgi:hypothetical protein
MLSAFLASEERQMQTRSRSRRLHLQFEQAERSGDLRWFAENYFQNRRYLRMHYMMTMDVNDWTNFETWLSRNSRML